MLFSEGSKAGKLYFDTGTEQYFVITQVKNLENGSTEFTYDLYSDYTFDKEAKRYIGVGYKGTKTNTQDSKGNVTVNPDTY